MPRRKRSTQIIDLVTPRTPTNDLSIRVPILIPPPSPSSSSSSISLSLFPASTLEQSESENESCNDVVITKNSSKEKRKKKEEECILEEFVQGMDEYGQIARRKCSDCWTTFAFPVNMQHVKRHVSKVHKRMGRKLTEMIEKVKKTTHQYQTRQRINKKNRKKKSSRTPNKAQQKFLEYVKELGL